MLYHFLLDIVTNYTLKGIVNKDLCKLFVSIQLGIDIKPTMWD